VSRLRGQGQLKAAARQQPDEAEPERVAEERDVGLQRVTYDVQISNLAM